MEKTLRYLAEKHPKFKASSDRVVLKTLHGSIHAQTHRIEFVKPRLKLFGTSKFTSEDAIAMAKLASQNEHMLAKGIRLKGTDEQQAFLRADQFLGFERDSRRAAQRVDEAQLGGVDRAVA